MNHNPACGGNGKPGAIVPYGMFQTSLTVCSEGSTAFQAVRNTTAGWKPALRTVKLKWPILNHAYWPDHVECGRYCLGEWAKLEYTGFAVTSQFGRTYHILLRQNCNPTSQKLSTASRKSLVGSDR